MFSVMKFRIAILGAAFIACAAAVLRFQSKWQLHGTDNRDFIKIVRRFASNALPDRGPILDRTGEILAWSSSGEKWKRTYPFGLPAAHPIGYFNRSYGAAGCERALDAVLSTNSAGFSISIDAELQKFVYDRMRGKKGAVIVMEPRSGRIRAMVSVPAFDPAAPGKSFKAKNAPLLNRALNGLYPPGSTFKLFMAAAALSNNLNPSINCPPGGFCAEDGSPPVRDSEVAAYLRQNRKWRGFGVMSMQEAIVHSSNVYFAQLGVMLGAEKFNKALATSRLREAVTVLGTGEESLESSISQIPDAATAGELAQDAIGQGELCVTPLTIAMLTCAIANGGYIFRPTLNENAQRELFSRPFRMTAAQYTAEAMRQTVLRGTAKGCVCGSLEICGKTGTAQNGSGADHAWFTSFAPKKKAKYVVTVIVENGGFGAASAMPVAKDVYGYLERKGFFK